MRKTFLIEIGTEELPPKDLRLLGESFKNNFIKQITTTYLQYDNIIWYASPRRLALKVINLTTYENIQKVKKLGPAICNTFDKQGELTIEAKKWLDKNKITIKQTERLINTQGEWLVYYSHNKSKSAKTLLMNIIIKSLNTLPIKKLMRWGNTEIKFIRPVHTITMLLDDQLITGEILGVKSKRIIYGHRFMGKSKLIINSAEQYPYLLYKYGNVIADYEERKKIIESQIYQIAHQLNGKTKFPNSLLEEVTSLVEWPEVLTAKFKTQFLLIPKEILIKIMINNHKYFPMYDYNNNLMTNFIFVVNIKSLQSKYIIEGNTKILNARLTDAEFFFKTDCLKRLEENLPKLKTIIFHKKLGTLLNKVDRLKIITNWIAIQIDANINHAIRASILSKCDLVTNMVYEFADIQGIIGMYYALKDGENDNVAIAIKEHYLPRFSNDKLPSNNISVILALADKLDTLVGILGINEKPSGHKDPFALRRITIGILRIIIEKKYNLDLLNLIHTVVNTYENKLININIINDTMEFIFKRCYFLYKKQGYHVNIIKAVLTCNPTKPVDFDARIKAVAHFYTLKTSTVLIIIHKRIKNVLKKSQEKLNHKIIFEILKFPEEIILAKTIIYLQKKLNIFFLKMEFLYILNELVLIQKLINNFFDNIIIMDKNLLIRINRLTLLNQLNILLLKIADFSLLK